MTTPEHAYTHARLAAERREVDIQVVSYEEVLAERPAAQATYILTDLDRLPAWRVRDAASLYRRLRQEGRRVLNDPARMLSRYGLLRRLHILNVNGFNAYRVEEFATPKRWPVFLRTEGDHDKPVSPLLQNKNELEEAIRRCWREGHPLSALLIVEYSAEPILPGLFRKLSVFRVGDRLLGYTCAHDDGWIVKYGKPGIAPPELYEQEFEIVRDNPYGAEMRKVFDVAGIEYGRVDFGLVAGRPQIYEINSNPDVKLRPAPSLAPRRDESCALFRTNYLRAMAAIDTRTS